MAQHDMEITKADANTGVSVRQQLNDALEAAATNQSGLSAPSTTYPCQLWADTTNGLLKMRNTGNTAWNTIGLLDQVLFDASKNMTLPQMLILSAGIKFPATQNPSSDPKTLDDYEEGTFTPTSEQITVGNGTFTGNYTKIGKRVWFQIGLNFGSTTAFSGTLVSIGDLPFAVGNWPHRVPLLVLCYDYGTGYYHGGAITYVGATSLSYPRYHVDTAIDATHPFTWTTNDMLTIIGSYEV